MNADKLTEIIRKSQYWDEEDNGYFTYHIEPTNYDDEIPEDKCASFLEDDDPKQAFYDYLAECSEYQTNSYYFDELLDKVQSCSEYSEYFTDEDENDVDDFVREHTSWIMRPEDWDREVCLNIGIDTSDKNYGFTCNNILNFYGEGKIKSNSSILWLAKQQGREQDFRTAIEKYPDFCAALDRETQEKRDEKSELMRLYHSESGLYNRETYLGKVKDVIKEISKIEKQVEADFGYDGFIKSVIEELENLTSGVGMLTFCVNANLLDILEIKEKNKIIVSKDTICGLFDPFGGGGSVLEIELIKDVVIPKENIGRIWIDESRSSRYDNIHSVYGVSDGMWKGELKIA